MGPLRRMLITYHSHAVFLLYLYPRRRSRCVATDEVGHFLFRYTIDVYTVPEAREHVDNVIGISLQATTEEHI